MNLIFRHCVCIHLDDPADKFQLLCFMTKKLFALADNKCAVEGADAVMMQECLLGGHLYLQVIKEKLYTWLLGLRANIVRRAKTVGNNFTLNVCKYFLNFLTSPMPCIACMLHWLFHFYKIFVWKNRNFFLRKELEILLKSGYFLILPI